MLALFVKIKCLLYNIRPFSLYKYVYIILYYIWKRKKNYTTAHSKYSDVVSLYNGTSSFLRIMVGPTRKLFCFFSSKEIKKKKNVLDG